ncbi:hypothetical protein FOZ60_011854, partial [Perkinsus olseni]
MNPYSTPSYDTNRWGSSPSKQPKTGPYGQRYCIERRRQTCPGPPTVGIFPSPTSTRIQRLGSGPLTLNGDGKLDKQEVMFVLKSTLPISYQRLSSTGALGCRRVSCLQKDFDKLFRRWDASGDGYIQYRGSWAQEGWSNFVRSNFRPEHKDLAECRGRYARIWQGNDKAGVVPECWDGDGNGVLDKEEVHWSPLLRPLGGRGFSQAELAYPKVLSGEAEGFARWVCLIVEDGAALVKNLEHARPADSASSLAMDSDKVSSQTEGPLHLHCRVGWANSSPLRSCRQAAVVMQNKCRLVKKSLEDQTGKKTTRQVGMGGVVSPILRMDFRPKSSEDEAEPMMEADGYKMGSAAARTADTTNRSDVLERADAAFYNNVEGCGPLCSSLCMSHGLWRLGTGNDLATDGTKTHQDVYGNGGKEGGRISSSRSPIQRSGSIGTCRSTHEFLYSLRVAVTARSLSPTYDPAHRTSVGLLDLKFAVGRSVANVSIPLILSTAWALSAAAIHMQERIKNRLLSKGRRLFMSQLNGGSRLAQLLIAKGANLGGQGQVRVSGGSLALVSVLPLDLAEAGGASLNFHAEVVKLLKRTVSQRREVLAAPAWLSSITNVEVARQMRASRDRAESKALPREAKQEGMSLRYVKDYVSTSALADLRALYEESLTATRRPHYEAPRALAVLLRKSFRMVLEEVVDRREPVNCRGKLGRSTYDLMTRAANDHTLRARAGGDFSENVPLNQGWTMVQMLTEFVQLYDTLSKLDAEGYEAVSAASVDSAARCGASRHSR